MFPEAPSLWPRNTRPPPPYVPPYAKLRLYLSEIRLPDMPLAEGCPPAPTEALGPESSYFMLSPNPDSRRKLRVIDHSTTRIKKHDVYEFIDHNISREPNPFPYYGPDMDLLLPAESFSIPFKAPPPVKDMPSLSKWIELPLMTAIRILRSVWPDQSNGFCLTGQVIYPDLPALDDGVIHRNFYWKSEETVDDNMNQSSYKLILAAVAPCALPTTDMEKFTGMKQFPAFTITRNRDKTFKFDKAPVFERSHKLWAKLWDDCALKRCPYFVVSTYNHWIFGVFTGGWTTAMVSEVVSHVVVEPSIVEWLIYWLASAMEIPGAFTPPKLERRDISDYTHVATKLLAEWEDREDHITPSQWLKKYHGQEGTGNFKQITQGYDPTISVMKFS